MLRFSTIDFRDQLKRGGLGDDEMDPYVIYSKVCSVIPENTEQHIGDLMWRFMTRTMADYDSLEAFQDDHEYLRRRMTELKVCPPDKFMIFYTLQKLEETMPLDHPFLERDFRKGNLTWNGLMEAVLFESRREIARGHAGLAKSTSSDRPGAQDTITNDQSLNSPDWDTVFGTLPKLEGVAKGKIKSLSWCRECQGFQWDGYSHHKTSQRNGCGKCHNYGECPDRNRNHGHERDRTQHLQLFSLRTDPSQNPPQNFREHITSHSEFRADGD